MRIGDDELQCRRLPMAHMRQEILARPSLGSNRYLLLLIFQMIDQFLKTCVILLERIQKTLLCRSFYCQGLAPFCGFLCCYILC